jgi:DNA polymerase
MAVSRLQKRSAADYLPENRSLPVMKEAVQSCQGCDLYRHATQAVFGEGAKHAVAMFIGEQPGDREDRQGSPFVGPAGRILDQALEEAGIDRKAVYVTNAVKHFKFEERGKRRIHKKPSAAEVAACRPWLEAEIQAVKPRILVALGATAAASIAGKQLQVMRDRGQFFPHELAGEVTVTVHPSALLRIDDPDQKKTEYERFVEDLRGIRARL